MVGSDVELCSYRCFVQTKMNQHQHLTVSEIGNREYSDLCLVLIFGYPTCWRRAGAWAALP